MMWQFAKYGHCLSELFRAVPAFGRSLCAYAPDEHNLTILYIFQLKKIKKSILSKEKKYAAQDEFVSITWKNMQTFWKEKKNNNKKQIVKSMVICHVIIILLLLSYCFFFFI